MQKWFVTRYYFFSKFPRLLLLMLIAPFYKFYTAFVSFENYKSCQLIFKQSQHTFLKKVQKSFKDKSGHKRNFSHPICLKMCPNIRWMMFLGILTKCSSLSQVFGFFGYILYYYFWPLQYIKHNTLSCKLDLLFFFNKWLNFGQNTHK